MSQDDAASEMNRRKLLKNASLVSLGATVHSASSSGASAATISNRHIVKGIDPRNVVDAYAARQLEGLSDAELYRQAANIISEPGTRGSNSFTIHAPLELMARYGLLSLVDPPQKATARLQMVASASAYESRLRSVELPARLGPFPNLTTARTEFRRAFQAADPDALESLVLGIAGQFGTASLVHLLTPLALPTLTGAAHSHIGLWLLLRHGTASNPRDAGLLRTAVRSLARQPELQLQSFGNMSISGGTPLKMTPLEIENEIMDIFSDPPKARQNGTSIRRLLEVAEQAGAADALFGDFIRRDLNWEQIDAAYRAVLRVCAHCMLQDSLDQAKFGWSHCLTLPQAACGLSSINMHRKLGLAATLVWTLARRSVVSKMSLDFRWEPERLNEQISIEEALQSSPQIAAARVWHALDHELPRIRQTLATQASIRNDQHLVKYTRACFDMVSFDPSHERLYLAASAHLCSLWTKERPFERIHDNLLLRRSP